LNDLDGVNYPETVRNDPGGILGKVIRGITMKETLGELTRLGELQECYEIMLKTARRCARDLRHAIDQIPEDNPFKEDMNERYLNFRTIFNDLSDYRIRLHLEIRNLENENEMLKKSLEPKDEKRMPLFEKGQP
jgi:hypothetical protein